MSSAKADFLVGARDVAPALPANVPFGIIAGVAAAGAGLSPVQTFVMSLTMFAGAAQIAATDLLGRDAPVVIVVLTALIVNLRYVMYSASIAPYFSDLSTRSKAVIAHFLLDVDYALSVTKFEQEEEIDHRAYFLGVGVPICTLWLITTGVGVTLGASIPEGWHLDFAIPLLFLSLLVPNIEARASAAAALGAGAIAVAGADLPFNLGLLVGAVTGILAGLVVDRVER